MPAPVPRRLTFGSAFAAAVLILLAATGLMYAWGAQVAESRGAAAAEEAAR